MSKRIMLFLVIILLIAGGLSLFASSFPDGLEYVAEQTGFIETAQDSILQIIPDYTVPGINSPYLATSLAGILGVVITVLIIATSIRLLSLTGKRQS